VQRDRLFRAGIIVPRIHGGDHGAADQFAPEYLNVFLATLLDGAQSVATIEGKVTIAQAAEAMTAGDLPWPRDRDYD